MKTGIDLHLACPAPCLLLLLGVLLAHTSVHGGDATLRDCCISTPEVQAIGLCVSGPGGTEKPAECAEIGGCFFRSDTPLALDKQRGTSPSKAAGPIPPRAFCYSDVVNGPIQSGSLGGFGIDLFSGFDADHDGDLDLQDLAIFQRTYQPAPKRVQSDAKLVAAECCFTLDERLSVGPCLGGPGEPHPPGPCTAQGTCFLAFSAPLEPGDEMHSLCLAAPFVEPDLIGASCVEWLFTGDQIEHECLAAYAFGITVFTTLDADADGDFDLKDFAEYQNKFAIE